MAISTVCARSFVKEATNWVVLELAIGCRPRTLAFQMEPTYLLGTGIPVRRLGRRTWRLSLAFWFAFAFTLCGAATVALLVTVLTAVAAFSVELRSLGFAFFLAFTASSFGSRNGQGVAARQALVHLGASPF